MSDQKQSDNAAFQEQLAARAAAENAELFGRQVAWQQLVDDLTPVQALAYAYMDQFNNEIELVSDAELGNRFRSFIVEAQHGNWDGVEELELLAAGRFLYDLGCWLKGCRQ